jgi:hypothetical protein
MLLAELGDRADKVIADIRARKRPPSHKPSEPIYDQPAGLN